MGEARIAMFDGNYAAALSHFERVAEVSYPSGGYSSVFERADARFLRADCLMALGRPEEALGWYEVADQNREFQLIYTGMAHLRQAEACEQLGRRAEAVEHYRIFLELYAESDPAYAEDVAGAQERLSLLEAAR